MRGTVKVGVAIAASTLALLALGTTLWVNRPFQVELASYRTSLADRTEAQRHNIRQAAMALDGVVIEPGGIFSFNQLVGPRTPERGYREAPAFMERDLVKSIGGGICQVSSTAYNAAALAGLAIVERHPHSSRIVSVPPGRDATVWFGMTDLKFENSFKFPIRLFARAKNEALYVAVIGRTESKINISLKTEAIASATKAHRYQTVRVTSFADFISRQELLSTDIYEP